MKIDLKSCLQSLKRSVDSSNFLFSYEAYTALILVALASVSFLSWRAYHFVQTKEVLENEFESLEFKIRNIQEDNRSRHHFETLLYGSDPRYLYHAIESSIPFASEAEFLEDILNFKAFKGFKAIQDALMRLHAGKGLFALNIIDKGVVEPLHESVHGLKSLVAVNTSDVKAILARVEGRSIEDWAPMRGRPDLFFRKFQLSKIKGQDGREQYELFFELVRRDRSLR